MNWIGAQAASRPNDGSDACPFPVSLFSTRNFPDVEFKDRGLQLLDMEHFELFLMLPTDWIPYIKKSCLHYLIDLVKTDHQAFLQDGFKAIASALEKGNAIRRNFRFQQLIEQLDLCAARNFEEFTVESSSALCRNLIFLARFSAYVRAHLHFSRHHYGHPKNISESDAKQALEVCEWIYEETMRVRRANTIEIDQDGPVTQTEEI